MRLEYAHSDQATAADVDPMLPLTESEYVDIDPLELGEVVRVKRILDGPNTWDPRARSAAGWRDRGIGRPASGGEQ